MWITSDEAVVMFARYCRARFGRTAKQKVRAKAQQLKKRGDIEGYDIWNRVADEIERGTKSSIAVANSCQDRPPDRCAVEVPDAATETHRPRRIVAQPVE